MDLSRPISALAPSLDGFVLEVLARTSRPITGREAHRLSAAGSETGVRLVLGRLVEHGLVEATQAGRATLYVANRDHIAWPIVEMMIGLRRELFSRMHDLITSWHAVPINVAVFGSAARGDGNLESDIDVLVIRDSNETTTWELQIDHLRNQVTSWTGNHCQIYELTDVEFAQHLASREPILDEWRRDAVDIFGKPLSQLMRGETA